MLHCICNPLDVPVDGGLRVNKSGEQGEVERDYSGERAGHLDKDLELPKTDGGMLPGTPRGCSPCKLPVRMLSSLLLTAASRNTDLATWCR